MKGLSLGLSLTGDGISLGAEMVLNGGFDTNSEWSAATEGGISGGTYNWTATTASRLSTNTNGTAPVAGRSYLVTYDVTARSGGSVNIRLGGTDGVSRTAVGSYSETIVAAGTTKTQLRATINTTASLDNVSVKEIL